MKSLLVASALTLAAQGSGYFVGNYSAGSSNQLVPYPLEVCVPDGGGFGYNYVVFHCTDSDTKIFKEVYEATDPECGGVHNDTTFAISPVPAQDGYAHCDDVRSYMEIEQYLGSCDDWEKGKGGVATTIIASGGCVYYGKDPTTGYSIYTKTICSSSGQTTMTYVGDASCSVPNFNFVNKTIPLGCSYFTKSSLGDIYSAMLKCVLDDKVQRCAVPISSYSSVVSFENLAWKVNMWEVYSQLFPYATLSIRNVSVTDYHKMTIQVNASFCTEWEDKAYGKYFKKLADYTLDSDKINDNATIIADCQYSYCVNSSICGGSSNCGDDCVNCGGTTQGPVTTELKSAAALFVSLFTICVTLFFSLF